MSTRRTKKSAQNRAIEGIVLPPAPDRIQLHTVEHVLREGRRIYRSMAAGELDVGVGVKLIWSLQAITAMTKDAILERRLAELEALAGGEQSATVEQLEYMEDEDE